MSMRHVYEKIGTEYVVLRKNGKEQIVGSIIMVGRERVFFTERRFTPHFYKKLQGYPISVETLDLLKELKIQRIRMLERLDDGRSLLHEIYVEEFDKVTAFQEVGYEPQKAIAMRLWKMVT
jgi:hypothetical protein